MPNNINYTLNQLIEEFKGYQETNGFINDFGYGQVYDISRSKPSQYPLMWVTHTQPSRVDIQNRVVMPRQQFTFLFLDQISQIDNTLDENGFDSNNIREIISDQLQWAMAFITYLMQLNYIVLGDIRYDVVQNETKDRLYGIRLDVEMEIKRFNCVIPQ